MDDFYKTRAGRQFIDSTMPKIAGELEKLNENIKALAQALRGATEAAKRTPSSQPGQ